MNSQDIRTSIASYLARFFPGHELRADEDIFSLGFVNSMFAMQLVTHLEHAYGLTVENEDLELDNFRSIDALHAFVERKRSAAA